MPPSSSSGRLLKGVATAIFVLVGAYDLVLGLLLVAHDFGMGTAVAGFFLFPVLMTLWPWYVLLAYGSWLPVLVVYGGGFLAYLLYNRGETLSAEGET